MSSTAWRVLTAVLVIASLAHVAASWGSFPSSAPLDGGWRTPIIAFELARTEADLGFLTGPDAEALRLAMDAGHVWDTSFPFLYGMLLASALVPVGRPLGRIGAALALLAIPLDLWENAQLIAITQALRQGELGAPWLPTLVVATWCKWGVLAASVGCYGLARRTKAPLASAMGVLAIALTLIAGVTGIPILGELMAGSVVLGIAVVALSSLKATSTP